MSNYKCDKIKMVIWDLDDTLWDGTISEGDVEIFWDRIDFIKYLNKKGIVNSICSKNDEKETMRFLTNKGLAELFVFSSINWQPKGKRIKEIIENANLREANILFVDDNPMNLQESVFYCKDIMTLLISDYEEFKSQMLALKLKDNPERLIQYRVLEKKFQARIQSSDNHDFLKSCNITVDIHHDCNEVFDRILELINRTNQLNFTKKRIDATALKCVLEDANMQTGYIVVNDDFGKYGITGFFALDTKENKLEHFLFSCRTMNMGIEQWLYRFLGKPQIDIVGEVSSDLDEFETIDWINQETNKENKKKDADIKNNLSFLFKGPCDISQAVAFINSPSMAEEYTYVSQRNGASVFLFNHTAFIRQSMSMSEKQKETMISEIPFVDREAFNTTLFSGNYDVVVFSLMVDYSLGIYKKKNGDYILPLFQYTLPITDPSLLEGYKNGLYYMQNLKFDETFYNWFVDNFEFVGPISKEDLVANILWIRDNIPQKTRLVLINGSVVPHSNPEPWMVGREKMHHEYNEYISKTLNNVEGIGIVDIGEIVSSPDDYYDNISHFKKKIYYSMAQEIVKASSSENEISVKSPLYLKAKEFGSMINRAKKALKNLRH